MSEEPRTEPINLKTTKTRRRLIRALQGMLDKESMTDVLEAALDEYIEKHMTPEMRQAILHRTNNHNHSHGDEDDPPSELPTARQPRAKSKAA